MARPQFTAGLAKLVRDWCALDQITQLLRDAKGTRDEVRVSAPNKEILVEKNLREAVESGAIPPDKIYSLVREAEENGNQHIFYYRRSTGGAQASIGDVGSRLWGAQWPEKIEFPKVDLVENDFIFSDLHQWNERLKPHDWVLKIYGHEFADKPTNIVEEIGDNRFKREFFREERRIVVVVRWNNPGILEMRVPLTESKKRVKQWLEKAWLMIAPACRPTEYSKWNLQKARRRMIDEQKQKQQVYRFSNTRLLDGDHNVASFECHDPQRHLFASQGVADSVKALIGNGECTHLRVTWLQGKNPFPSRELNTVVGNNESNEIVIGGYCSSQDVDYVTDQLRHFSR